MQGRGVIRREAEALLLGPNHVDGDVISTSDAMTVNTLITALMNAGREDAENTQQMQQH